MWLLDALPYDLTDESNKRPMARIMTYGYESNANNTDSVQSLESLATAFHASMLSLISPSKGWRPIVFIGHSLGGLIVKQVSKNA